MTDKKTRPKPATPPASGYDAMLSGVAGLLEEARRTSARAVNAIMTATYWEIGRRIVEYEQGGKDRAGYGKELIARLSADLTARFGRGFGPVNLSQMRRFYQSWPPEQIFQMASEKFVPAPPTGIASLHDIAARFPLPWSHYVRLMSVKTPHARTFYETEALRGGWSGPQLDRQFVGWAPPTDSWPILLSIFIGPAKQTF
jgi:hypothetical protein